MNKILLDDLRKVLRYHREIGISHYPALEDVKTFMLSTSMMPEKNVEMFVTRHQPVVEEKKPLIKSDVNSVVGLQEVFAEIEGCRKCSLAQSRIRSVCGRGAKNPKLLVVGDWGHCDPEEEERLDGIIFGRDEDAMLGRMFKAIHLEENDVFITNVVKCASGNENQQLPEHINVCANHLRRQIQVLNPLVICAMGAVPAKILCDVKAPLSRLRGRFHQYAVDNEKTIPLMVTYHPNYLLLNPEMKKATWVDLQLLQKILKEQTPF